MLKIRKVNREDCDILLAWRNHPEVYKYALSPAPVAYSDHVVWLEKTLSNPRYIFYMGILEDKPCGTVRFYLNEDLTEAEISISIGFDFWGKGIATELMMMAENQLKKDSNVSVIHATVLNDNIASLKLFNKSQYRPYLTKFKKKI